MPTSPPAGLFELTSAKISRGTLGYICARARQWAYDLLVSEFRKSGLSQADLCRRLDKAPEVISRMLSRPGNLELDTLSATIFAITGGLLSFSVTYPAQQDAVSLVPKIQMPEQNTSAQQIGNALDLKIFAPKAMAA